MNAFSLQMSLVDQGADITPIMKGWMDLSDGKGWPKNEEGWKRYLSRLSDSGAFPKVRSAASGRGKDSSPPPPDDFVEWWKHHLESGHTDGKFDVEPRLAYRAERYVSEWRASKLRAA